MTNQDPADAEGRVVSLQDAAAARRRAADSGPAGAAASPDADLRKYAKADDDDDYRHRMITNVAALGILLLLIAGGVWIADTMASIRKNQDCVLSGRRGCTPVEVPVRQRW